MKTSAPDRRRTYLPMLICQPAFWCFMAGLIFPAFSLAAPLNEPDILRIEEELISRLDELEQGLPPAEADTTLFSPESCEDIDESALPPDVLSQLRLLGDSEVECVYKSLFANALARRAQARDTPSVASQQAGGSAGPPPIMWDGQLCGCVPAANHIVYGLYPLSMASGSEQIVDFSVLSRIGYDSLTFDENGRILDPVHWRKEKPYSNFINEARRYRTKIDLVISNQEWEKWGDFTPGETSVVIDKLSNNILNLLNVPLSNDWLNVLKPYISFGYSPMRTMGDGVTIHFDFQGVPDKDPAKIFSRLYSFINTLRDQLDQTGRPFFLNMIVPIEDIVGHAGVYQLGNLKKLTDDVNVFLVKVPDPVADGMKQLRAEVEQQFPIQEQQAMVRKMLPILTPEMPIEVLQDGLAYAEDNFGGVGMSPIPLVGEGQGDAVNRALKAFLHSEDGVLCQVVCSYRWTLRAIIFFLGVFGVGYGLLAIGLYELRHFYAKHSRVFLVVALFTLIPFALTFACDPFWKDRQSELLFLALILGGGGLIWKLQQRKEGTYP